MNRPPLATPSPSPHPHSSPSKRHRTTPSSNSRPQTPDVQKEREGSRRRLLDVWGSLAERYSRHMDDDDVVDIRTGDVTRDNGFLRSARIFEFGSLVAPLDESSEDEGDEADDEYGFDELDAFAEPSSEDARSDTGESIVPPPALYQHTDADDLREFVEAEKLRKEQYGTDVDEESEGQRDDEADELEPRDDPLEFVEGHSDCSESIVLSSDDELDFWKADDAHKVRVGFDDESRSSTQKPSPEQPRKYRPQSSLKRKRNSSSPDIFTPIPDPRARLIIAQAVQQLTELAAGTWQPRTPHRVSPHSQAHHTTPLRRSLVSQSHSRGRKVSFQSDDEA